MADPTNNNPGPPAGPDNETKGFLKSLRDRLAGGENHEDIVEKRLEKMEQQNEAIFKEIEGISDFLVKTIGVQLSGIQTMNSTLMDIRQYTLQMADNVYNIAGHLGAQVTSMKEVADSLAMDKAEAETEAAGQKGAKPVDEGPDYEKTEKKAESFWEKLGKFFEVVLIPLIAGFVLGLSKGLGIFDTSLGKIVTLLGIVAIAFKPFRSGLLALGKALFTMAGSLVKFTGQLLTKAFPALGKFGDKLKGFFTKAPGGAPGAPGGVPGVPGGDPTGPAGKQVSKLSKLGDTLKSIGKGIKTFILELFKTLEKVAGSIGKIVQTLGKAVGNLIKTILTGLADGLKKMGDTKVLKGAASLVLVASSMLILAKALKEFEGVGAKGAAIAAAALTGLVGALFLFSKLPIGDVVKGTLALGLMAGALYIAGKALQNFIGIDWETLGIATAALVGLTAAVVGMGLILPLIVAGSAALAAMGVALLAFGAALNVVAAALPTLGEFIEKIGQLDGQNLLLVAAGLGALGLALVALTAGNVVSAIGNFFAALVPGDDIFEKLTKLGKAAQGLKYLQPALKALKDFADFEPSDKFEATVDRLVKALGKLAEAAKKFQGSTTAFREISLAIREMNLSAANAAQAPAAAPAREVAPPAQARQPAAPAQARPAAAPAREVAPPAAQRRTVAAPAAPPVLETRTAPGTQRTVAARPAARPAPVAVVETPKAAGMTPQELFDAEVAAQNRYAEQMNQRGMELALGRTPAGPAPKIEGPISGQRPAAVVPAKPKAAPTPPKTVTRTQTTSQTQETGGQVKREFEVMNEDAKAAQAELDAARKKYQQERDAAVDKFIEETGDIPDSESQKGTEIERLEQDFLKKQAELEKRIGAGTSMQTEVLSEEEYNRRTGKKPTTVEPMSEGDDWLSSSKDDWGSSGDGWDSPEDKAREKAEKEREKREAAEEKAREKRDDAAALEAAKRREEQIKAGTYESDTARMEREKKQAEAMTKLQNRRYDKDDELYKARLSGEEWQELLAKENPDLFKADEVEQINAAAETARARRLEAMGKRTAPDGTALSEQSQAIAGAQTGGGSTNAAVVNAPSSTVVGGSTTVNNTGLAATPTYGQRESAATGF